MYRIVQFMFLIAFASAVNAQDYNKDSLLAVIRDSRYIENEHIGMAHVKSQVYEAACQLWEQCTATELEQLCKSEDPELRCYAFLGIIACKNDRVLAEQIADLHKDDKEGIVSWSTCIQWSFTVSDYMEMKLREFYSGEKGYRRLDK